jgi:peptidoglycan/LPS O-acetylase OafA/YrhL
MLQTPNADIQMSNGIRYFGIDFLRGISILLVLCRHQYLSGPTSRMGWIGVDMFFVISGFLIGSKLLEEHIRFGTIAWRMFLLRRLLRILPFYWIVSLIYIFWFVVMGWPIGIKELFYDLILVQNYMNKWGFLQSPTWSLAVEEHFYILATLVGYLAFNYWGIQAGGKAGIVKAVLLGLSVLVICNALRVVMMVQGEYSLTQTHVRIETPVIGMVLSYLYLFANEMLVASAYRWRKLIFMMVVFLLAWTPFIEPMKSDFARTAGISCLSVAFGGVLVLTIASDVDGSLFGKLIRSRMGEAISRIGKWSFSIYLMHALVNSIYSVLSDHWGWLPKHNAVAFGITSVVCIGVGGLLSRYVEGPILKIRNREVGSRVG